MTINNLNDWKGNFLTKHVQPNLNPEAGNFLSSESLVIAIGPSSAAYTIQDFNTLVPVGLVQNIQVSQQKQINQMFEIGSRKPFFIPGRTMVSAGLSRVMFDGPSLMQAMYMIKADSNDTSYNMPKWPEASDTLPLKNPVGMNSGDQTKFFEGKGELGDTSGSTKSKPSFFFSNLASSFFNIPVGMAVFAYDMQRQAYGGMYLEECYIQSHSFSASSQQTVLVENISIRCSDVYPVHPNVMTSA